MFNCNIYYYYYYCESALKKYSLNRIGSAEVIDAYMTLGRPHIKTIDIDGLISFFFLKMESD